MQPEAKLTSAVVDIVIATCGFGSMDRGPLAHFKRTESGGPKLIV